MKCIATFESHFCAMQFKKLLGNDGIVVILSPVPRCISASCGTCARYEVQKFLLNDKIGNIVEKIYEVSDNKYTIRYESVGNDK